jgi:hypothetical protein
MKSNFIFAKFWQIQGFMRLSSCGRAMCNGNMAMFQNSKQTYWCRYIIISAVLAGVAPCWMLTINAAFYAKRQDEKTTRHHIAAHKPEYSGN